jgi:hypothetical protein
MTTKPKKPAVDRHKQLAIVVRATPAEITRWSTAAKDAGLTRTEWIRRRLFEAQ